MLVLSRRLNEKIVFPDLGITVQVVAIKPGVVRIGIEAPPDIAVCREEILGMPQVRGTPRHAEPCSV